MFVHERHEAILAKLHEQKTVRVAELTAEYRVSIETIRRDLEGLEKKGLLKRVHGGAVLEELQSSAEQNFKVRNAIRVEQKRQLAEVAATLVKEGQSLAMDVSTTNTELAKVLVERFERLTILTNSLPIVEVLAQKPNFTIIMPAGIVRNEELCIVGDLAEQSLSHYHIDTFFMSMSGISLTRGLTDYGVGEVQVKKKMHDISQTTYVVADSSKFGSVALLSICPFDEVAAIITDQQLLDTTKREYEMRNIQVWN